MKRFAIIIPTLAAAVMINAVPSLSEEGTTPGGQEAIIVQKDECLLVALNCPDTVDTLSQKIDKLETEINKGTAVYTDAELEILKKKLNEAQDVEQNINKGY